jgi:uncharacterized protein (TIGR02246 family)
MTDFIVADCGIRQLHARFVDAVFRKDANAFAENFAEQGEWKLAGLHMRGRADIGATFAKLLGSCARVELLVGTPILEVGQGTAAGRVHVTELAKLVDGTAAMTIGVYYDRYVEEGGHWRFLWRHFALHYRGPVDLSAARVDSPDYGPPPGMPGADEPTLTRRAPAI